MLDRIVRFYLDGYDFIEHLYCQGLAHRQGHPVIRKA